MADSTISGPIHMFTVCLLRKQLIRCRGPLRTQVGYLCVEVQLLLNIVGLGVLSSYSLYCMVIGEGISESAGGSIVELTIVEYVAYFCDGGWGT